MKKSAPRPVFLSAIVTDGLTRPLRNWMFALLPLPLARVMELAWMVLAWPRLSAEPPMALPVVLPMRIVVAVMVLLAARVSTPRARGWLLGLTPMFIAATSAVKFANPERSSVQEC